MKRLLDDDLFPGTPESWLADLVRATPRIEEDPFYFERVRKRILHVPQPRNRRRGLALTAGLALAVIASVAAAASAVRYGAGLNHPKPDVSAPNPMAPISPPAVNASSTAEDDLVDAGNAAVDTDKAPDAIPPPNAVPDPKPSTPVGDSSSLAKPVASMEDPKLVLDAIRALRSSRDASKSSALLAQYLKTHPRGALAEDALALSIESASARHDAAAAASYGRAYLAQYPNGRFRAMALRAAEKGRR